MHFSKERKKEMKHIKVEKCLMKEGKKTLPELPSGRSLKSCSSRKALSSS